MTRLTVEPVTWWKYVESVTSDGPTVIAAKSGVSGPTASRWKGATKRPDPEAVAAFARSYGRTVLEAFIAAGFLTPQEAQQRPTAPPSLATLTDDELIDEIRSRLRRSTNEGQQPEVQKRVRVVGESAPTRYYDDVTFREEADAAGAEALSQVGRKFGRDTANLATAADGRANVGRSLRQTLDAIGEEPQDQ